MIRLGVRVARARAELVLAELLVLSPAGLEERDVDPDTVEFALYGAAEGLPDDATLRGAVRGALVEVTRAEIPEDWSESWKAWHRPVEVTGSRGRLRVRPPWEPALDDAPGRVIELVIDPGQAFGTGAHPTTKLCLELLLGLEPAGALADWGTGSGVLALAAARLGWAPVRACDHERPAVAATRENARVNGIAGVEAFHADLLADPLPWAPIVTANLVRPLLLAVAERLERAPERLIVSGLLREEADEVAGAYARYGLEETSRREEAEWAALLLERPGGGGGGRAAPVRSTSAPGRG